LKILTDFSIKEIIKELNEPKIVKEKEEKIVDNRITSGSDVLLSEEIHGSLRKFQFNSLYYLNENLRSIHNKKLNEFTNINKTKVVLDNNEVVSLERKKIY
jgi:hypothetical protein